MRNLIPRRRPNPPRRLLARLLPDRPSIVYGPEKYTPDKRRPYLRVCNRCLRNVAGGAVEFWPTLAAARASAKQHRRTPGHRWMRVVYDPEGS